MSMRLCLTTTIVTRHMEGKTKRAAESWVHLALSDGRPRGLSGVGFSVPESYLAPSETSGGELGHENASKCPIGNGSPVTSAAQMVRIPRAKQLIRRCLARCLLKRRAIWVGGNVSILLCGKFASTSPPTLMTHTVATAITNQCRSARLGSVILV
jgi:hypothetical protein